jgi:hypothetical protein
MIGTSAGSWNTFDRVRLTDLQLGLLQDSGWYDVKYGSGGFSSYGYGAGCGFAMGDIQQASTGPGARHVCTPQQMTSCDRNKCYDTTTEAGIRNLYNTPALRQCVSQLPAGCNRCLSDWSGDGICQSIKLATGFTVALPVRSLTSAGQLAPHMCG